MSRKAVFGPFNDLADSIYRTVTGPTILNGEIVCLDSQGRSQFNDLLFHRSSPFFFAFDVAWHARNTRNNVEDVSTRRSAVNANSANSDGDH